MTLPTKVAIGAIAALVVVLVAAGWLLDRAYGQAREAQLEARNARAEASVTETGLVELAGAYRRLHTRLVEEHEVEVDDLTAWILEERRARATAQAQITLLGDSLVRIRTGTVRVDTILGTVLAADSIDATDTLGVAAAAEVFIAVDRARWHWRLYRPPIALTLTLGCAEQNAVVHLEGPPWLPAEFTRVQQDDAICVPPPRGWNPFRLEVPSLPVTIGLIVLGAVLESRLHVLP